MGTKVQIENYLPAHCSMRDLNHESNGASWPSCYGDSNLPNGQFYYGFLPRTIADSHPGYDKDVVKQTMLEHEAIFKNQVYELHRLYRVQRDLMDEVRRKEQFKRPLPYETSSSSSPVPSQMQSEDMQRWNGSSLPFANSVCGRPPIYGPDTVQSSPHSEKGKSIQASPSSFPNCHSPKNSEVSESRPTKFRRRMLDLRLPADEYIDTDEVEQSGDVKRLDSIGCSPDKNGKYASGNGKLLLNSPPKKECHGDVSRSDSYIGKSKALADLNEPLHMEETTAVSSVDFLGHTGCQNDVPYRDLSAKILSPSKDVPQSSRHGSLNGTLNSSPFESRPNSQDWFRYTLESEQHKGNVRSINQGFHPEKVSVPSQPAQILLDQACQPPAFLSGDHIKGDLWRAKSGGILEKSDRSYSLSSYNTPEPILPAHAPNQPTLFHPSDMRKSWDQCGPSWGRPGSCLSQKSITVQNGPFLNSACLSKSPQSSAQSNDLFGNKWNLNNTPGTHAAYVGEPSMRNGFYQGSVTSFKELPVHFPRVGFDYANCSGNSYLKAATCTDVSPVKDMNLNVPPPNGISNNHIIGQQGLKVVDNDHKSVDHLAVLPWLRGKSGCNNEAENSRKGLNPLETVQTRGPSFASGSCDVDLNKVKEAENSDCLSSRKILGVPIFENPPMPKKENSAVISTAAINHRAGVEQAETSRRKGGFDMNLPCEPSDSDTDMAVEVVVVEKKVQTESASIKNRFDLNSCITEEEILCGTSLPYNSTAVKGGTGIDLEAPVILESEDDFIPNEACVINEPEKQPELPPDRADNGEAELAKSAAEAIVAISLFVDNLNQSEEKSACLPEEVSIEEALNWFVDIACSSGNDSENHLVSNDRDEGGCLPEGLDDFESMTLRLKGCSFEEYFPKPSIPEFPNMGGNGPCVLTTRTRKGQARRGRQRRDFQRDILPGLASLSRHEVTEDLQTFGGLMRATGHPWHSGPNRRNATRNGGGRGRRRTVAAAPAPTPATNICTPLKEQQQPLPNNSTEVVLEDRSLIGWGKTTRRPRRQRCPAGNPSPPVPLS